MPEYTIYITKTAQKQLSKLPDDVTETLLAAIQTLAGTPDHPVVKNSKAGMVTAFDKATVVLSTTFLTILWWLMLLPLAIARMYMNRLIVSNLQCSAQIFRFKNRFLIGP